MQSILSTDDALELRTKLAAMEDLPTIQRGKRDLGMHSLFEWFSQPERVYNQKTPITHAMQRPYVFFPGLRALPFHDPSEFPWAARVEAETPAIVAELEQLFETRRGFQAFRRVEDGGYGLQDAAGSDEGTPVSAWNMSYFFFGGAQVAENAALCPHTSAVLASIPRFCRMTVASFSAINGPNVVAPHYGANNAVLRVHLGLHVPPGCRIRVGQQSKRWQAGKLMFFSDAFEHQVWIEQRATRVVLFFDVLHPDWADDELSAVEDFLCPDELKGFVGNLDQLRAQDAHRLDGKRWWI